MCPLPGWASSGQRRDASSPAQRPVIAGRYAMNMRAADAIVSRAPKAMKIFPISEVWSQRGTVVSRGACRRLAVLEAEAIATRLRGRGSWLFGRGQRPIDGVELVGGDRAGARPAPLRRPACPPRPAARCWPFRTWPPTFPWRRRAAHRPPSFAHWRWRPMRVSRARCRRSHRRPAFRRLCCSRSDFDAACVDLRWA